MAYTYLRILASNYWHIRKKPQKADIEYKVNQKINAVAPKMTDTGSTVIVDETNKQFNETVTKRYYKKRTKWVFNLKMKYLQLIK